MKIRLWSPEKSFLALDTANVHFFKLVMYATWDDGDFTAVIIWNDRLNYNPSQMTDLMIKSNLIPSLVYIGTLNEIRGHLNQWNLTTEERQRHYSHQFPVAMILKVNECSADGFHFYVGSGHLCIPSPLLHRQAQLLSSQLLLMSYNQCLLNFNGSDHGVKGCRIKSHIR